MDINCDYNDYDGLSKAGHLSKPLIYLAPDYKNEDPEINDEYPNILSEVEKWDEKKISEGLTQLIYKHLSNWKSRENDTYMYGLWCVLAMIEDLRMNALLPLVLEILKQDAEFHNKFFIDEKFITMPAAVIFRIMKVEDLPMLADFMKTPGLTSYGKRQVALACGHFPTGCRESLPCIQQWLSDVLTFYYSSDEKSALFDGELLETLIYCSIHTRSTELKKLIIRIYGKFDVPCSLVKGGCNEVRKSISTGEMGTMCEMVDDSAAYMLKGRIIDSWDDDDFDEDKEWKDDDDFDPDKYERQQFCGWTFNSKAKYKSRQHARKYTLRISLKGTKPPIWRKIEVPSNITLSSLAGVIILSMGWEEDHLHEFVTSSRQCYATSINEPDDSIMESMDGRRYSIGDLLMFKGDSVVFKYDYGDGWTHTVKLAEVADYGDDMEKSVKLLSGKRACPPEDCGGIWGYMSLCEAMEHPKSSEAREYMEWLGCKFDPEYFPLDQVKSIVDRCNRK